MDPSRFAYAVVAREMVRRVAIACASQGVPVMPLKGVALHAMVYADPAERPIGDVDLLVAERDFETALRVLDRMGFRIWPHAEITNDTQRCLRQPDLPLLLDLHRALFAPGRYDMQTRAVLARGRHDETRFEAPVLLPDPYDLYAHLVGHFAADHADARDSTHLHDFRATARALALDPARCALHLDRCGLGRAARYVLGIVETAAPDPFSRTVLETLERDPLGELLARGARRLVEGAPARSFLPGLSAHALNTSLPHAATALSRAALQRLVMRTGRLLNLS